VKAASGRQRFNVLGAWNAVTRELLTITNTTVVNTDTMCDLLRTIADLVRRTVARPDRSGDPRHRVGAKLFTVGMALGRVMP
jgi:hypothetical protein